MTNQIRSIALAAACIAPLLPYGMPTAEAKQCSAAVPSDPQGHWSYRVLDGRKCWYEGKNMLPKSSLRWSAKAAAQPNADERPVTALAKKSSDPVDADACCWPALDSSSDSFESRWRATLDAKGKY